MMQRGPSSVVSACYGEWSASYFDEYYGADAPYPPVHVPLIVDVLQARGAKTVLDAGCGPASILRTLVERGFDCWGFDLTAGMVEEAQAALRKLCMSTERVWQGDATDAAAYRNASANAPRNFDAAMAIGVLPHLPRQGVEATFRNLHGAVRPGGVAIVQARNALFSMFTFNRNTREFVRDELLAVDEYKNDGERAFMQDSLAQLAAHMRVDLPANRGGTGYDDTQPGAENPLTLPQAFASHGFSDVEVLFYHYHAAPPMCEPIDSTTFRAMSVAMERDRGPRDWRGHFMASSFLLVGTRT
jgi:SAM-dependent methyltransferase